MPSVLEEVLASLDAAAKAADSPRRTEIVEEAPERTPLPKRRTSKTAPTSSAASAAAATVSTPKTSSVSAITRALESLEPGALDTTPAPVEEKRPLPAKAAPVTRPNGQPYFPRKLAGRVDVEALRDLRKAGVSVLFSGYPGCGKTSLVEAAFAEEGGPVTFAGHGEAEVGDLVGSYKQLPDGSFVWNDGPLPRAMKEGRVLFVDDATLTPSGVLARLYPAMDGRGVITLTEHEGEDVHAAPGFYVVGAHNPGVPGAILSEALASRFSVHLEVPTDLNLAVEMGVERPVVSVAKAMQKKREKGEVLWAPEMRELLAYQKIRAVLGREAALENLVSICPEPDRDAFKPLLTKLLAAVKPLTLDEA